MNISQNPLPLRCRYTLDELAQGGSKIPQNAL